MDEVYNRINYLENRTNYLEGMENLLWNKTNTQNITFCKIGEIMSDEFLEPQSKRIAVIAYLKGANSD